MNSLVGVNQKHNCKWLSIKHSYLKKEKRKKKKRPITEI